jgi:hypothetical protein
MQPRTVALVAAMSLALGWLASSVVSPVPPAAQPGAPRGPRPIGVTEPPASYTEQLRRRLDAQPRSPSPQRNLFVFSGRRAPAPRRTEPEPAAAPQMPVLAAGPAFSLAGVATSTVDGQPVHTAIVKSSSGLLFVKAGEPLPGGYTVTRVEDSYALIMDAAGVEQTLKLKQ